MSISPSKQKPRAPHTVIKNKLDVRPLSLSQALTITAGMAGLIGLVSGAVIRFLLTSSPDASFLSPIQTFPTSSNWSTTLPEPSSSGLASPPHNDTPEIGQESTNYPSSFDEFASRSGRPSQYMQAPLERLRSGPLLREPVSFDSDGQDITIPDLEDPAFEPYYEPDSEYRPFSQ
ncbi:hypothetical protein S7335_5376 [Synechococcus sp. PCC 7335]|uniref:hypothetical protein n=1 Tax=Synechococcus sp. (strain ATCC 29403 / PCC 7335) TaxID=91464 RepID=UPI00017EB074|nr:hypothetical protein [Synechococcus sp. PCC 7335]EDX87666.1 hypothetical protein S7335_5376 [Synechococcus sp. PCC 7335]